MAEWRTHMSPELSLLRARVQCETIVEMLRPEQDLSPYIEDRALQIATALVEDLHALASENPEIFLQQSFLLGVAQNYQTGEKTVYACDVCPTCYGQESGKASQFLSPDLFEDMRMYTPYMTTSNTALGRVLNGVIGYPRKTATPV